CGNASCQTPPESLQLQLCGGCKKAAYCSQDCQTAAWASHKKNCKRQNYIIEFHLRLSDIVNLPVVCTLSCPADAPFYTLNLALQVAFGWATTHSFDFAVMNPN
ncbi:mynd domain-containing protein, partial [Lasiosphaeris hirsuta]